MSASLSAAAFHTRLEILTPTLRRIARASVGAASEHQADDLFQTIILKLLERAAADPSFAERPDQELITFAIWRARSKAEAGRIYTRYCPNEEYIPDDDGELTPELELIPDTTQNPETLVIAAETVRGVGAIITDPTDRVITSMLVQGYNGVEIGSALGVTKGTISQHRTKIAATVTAYMAGAH